MTLIPFDAHADRPTQIAFVDTGNTGRSVMATALAEVAIRKDGLLIAVIGRAVDMNPFFVSPEANAAALLLKQGIDVTGHRAEQLTINDVRHADLIITMTAKHKDAIIALNPETGPKIHTIAEYATGTARTSLTHMGSRWRCMSRSLRRSAPICPPYYENRCGNRWRGAVERR